LAYHLDTEAFLFAAHDMDRGEFAALDTLQYGLARDAERAHCLAHRQEVLAGITVEAIPEVFSPKFLLLRAQRRWFSAAPAPVMP
jgi:hypothetical protein